MITKSVARVVSVAWTAAFFGSLAAGCDDGWHDGYRGDYGAGYGGYDRHSGIIRFEWSLAGARDAGSAGAAGATLPADEDAGETAIDGGLAADAGARAAGSIDQAVCDALGASQFQALLYDQGTIVAAFQARCAAGAASYRVASNDYTATAELVSREGVPVTATEPIARFVIAPGEKQLIAVTFDAR